MYQVVLNEKEKINIEDSKGILKVEGNAIDWDVQQIDSNIYHLIYNNKSYTLEVLHQEDKKYQVKVNGKIVGAEVKDKLDLLLEKLGLDISDAGKLSTIKAPMPGLIVEIKVKPGDEVKKGDQLLILEAMKMENVIKSPGEGTVKAVTVKKGDGVEKNQVMIQF